MCSKSRESIASPVSHLTLHEQIRTGELTKRREENGGGAGIHLDPALATDAQPAPLVIRTGGA